MKALRLAFSFVRVPKLFVSLLFWPLVVGLSIAAFQAVLSSAYFGYSTESVGQFETRLSTEADESKWLRKQLFGSGEALPPLIVCRWQQLAGENNTEKEQPPGEACAISPYDVALQTPRPETLPISKFVELFRGSTRKLHICRNCQADVTLHGEEPDLIAEINGFGALAVYMLVDSSTSTKLSPHYVAAKRKIKQFKNLGGTMKLHIEGSPHPINITQANKMVMLIINTSLMTIIALWLSLKGHRKVLDYFARNGALLPLVAACGKETFYTSLWIITLFRVLFFLIAALPATIVVVYQTVPSETLQLFIKTPADFLLWVSGIITSLSCLAIIASIAELKHRHSWVSFLYRYVPLCLCLVGTAAWLTCILNSGELYRILQNLVACIPIIGISPILLSPLLNQNSMVLSAHVLLSSVLMLLTLKLNSQWFAAHLEEI